jgi:hypothetical protein
MAGPCSGACFPRVCVTVSLSSSVCHRLSLPLVCHRRQPLSHASLPLSLLYSSTMCAPQAARTWQNERASEPHLRESERTGRGEGQGREGEGGEETT